MEETMKRMIDQARAVARANPVGATAFVLLVAVILALGLALGEQLGWEVSQFTH
jgi:hypothetical protein